MGKPEKLRRRLETVGSVAASADFLKGPLVGALVNCLDIQELADVLLSAPNSVSLLRRAVMRTLSRDTHRLAVVRQRVLGPLLRELGQADYRRARILGGILAELAGLDMPLKDRRRVLSALLSSRFAQVRTSGYKAVRQGLNDPDLDALLRRVWRRYSDPLCASLIVNRAPLEFLLSEFDELDSALHGVLSRARLYIRVAEKDPSVLRRLRESDEVAWTYAKVKLGHTALSSEEALALFWRNDTHPDLALLLWCYGQMHLWDVLVEVASSQDYFKSVEYFEKKYSFRLPRTETVDQSSLPPTTASNSPPSAPFPA